ncbi:MAG: MFS transporter, partial [Dongiaceae bacterium]
MRHDQPIWLKTVTTPGAMVFAIMFTLESLARATLWTIVPLQAYALLGSERDVTLLNLGVSVFGTVAGLTVPLLIRGYRRRWVYSLGVAMTILAAILIATGTIGGQIGGMLARAFGGAASSIALTLYVMDYIRRRDLVYSEPLRMKLSAGAWASGPFLGVFLNDWIGPGTGESLTVLSGVVLLAYFWFLRINDNPAVAAATQPPPNPLKSIARFVAQPRLRLGWFIPFGRSCWWSMFGTYPPIYMVQQFGGGVDEPGRLYGSLLVSVANGLLFGAPFAGRLAAKFGLRRPVIWAFVGMGVLTCIAALFYETPMAVTACLLLAAVGAMVLDALGGIPFLRSVHPYERPQMTAVYRTYIDLSDLLPAALFAFLLSYFDIRAVFL